jgi:hypothetical protein
MLCTLRRFERGNSIFPACVCLSFYITDFFILDFIHRLFNSFLNASCMCDGENIQSSKRCDFQNIKKLQIMEKVQNKQMR